MLTYLYNRMLHHIQAQNPVEMQQAVRAIASMLHRRVSPITEPLLNAANASAQAAAIVARRIIDLIKEHRHEIIFIGSTLYAAWSFPHLFCAGIPIGAVMAFLVGQTVGRYDHDPSLYLCREFLYEGGITQFTLGSLNMMGKSIVYLNNGRFSVGQEGIISSLLSGAIAGAYAASAIGYVVDTIRRRVL